MVPDRLEKRLFRQPPTDSPQDGSVQGQGQASPDEHAPQDGHREERRRLPLAPVEEPEHGHGHERGQRGEAQTSTNTLADPGLSASTARNNVRTETAMAASSPAAT